MFAGNFDDRSNNAIVNFDTVKMTTRWSATGAYAGNPAYASGTLFAANNKPFRLEARKEMDGTVLWSWVPPTGETKFVSDVLVTNNLVFVSADARTYAIDKLTHAAVWSIAASGTLSVSANGILYITGSKSIAAINLHQLLRIRLHRAPLRRCRQGLVGGQGGWAPTQYHALKRVGDLALRAKVFG